MTPGDDAAGVDAARAAAARYVTDGTRPTPEDTVNEWPPDPLVPDDLSQPRQETDLEASRPEGRAARNDPERMRVKYELGRLGSLAEYHISKHFPPFIKRVLVAEIHALKEHVWEAAPDLVEKFFHEVASWPPAGLTIAPDGTSWTPDMATLAEIAELRARIEQLEELVVEPFREAA